jgi:hypothetical protein
MATISACRVSAGLPILTAPPIYDLSRGKIPVFVRKTVGIFDIRLILIPPLCLSEIKRAHTDDGVRQVMA